MTDQGNVVVDDETVASAKLAHVLHTLIDSIPHRVEADAAALHDLITASVGHGRSAAHDAVHSPEDFAAAYEAGAYTPPVSDEPVPQPDDRDARIAELEAKLAAAQAEPLPHGGPTEPAEPSNPGE